MPYLTPDSPPEDTVCRVLRIPNDVFWLSIVDGALSELCRPFRFEQQGSATPQETADRFLVMYEDFVSQNCEEQLACCYDTILRRVNPTTGRLEISRDGGETWIPDPQDPLYQIVQLPAPVPAGVSGTKCDAATNGQQHLEDIILGHSNAFEVATTVLEFIAACVAVIAAAVFAPEVEPVLLPILAATLAALFALGKTAFDAYWTTTETDKLLCALYCHISDDGTFTESQFQSVVADIGTKLTAGVPRDMMVRDIQAMGRTGLNNLCAYGNAADSDCDSCSCDEFTLFDLSGQTAGHLVQDETNDHLWHYTVDTFDTNGYYGTVGFEADVNAETFTLGVGGKLFWEFTSGSNTYVFCVHKCTRGDTTFSVTDPIGQCAILQWYDTAPFTLDITVLADTECP